MSDAGSELDSEGGQSNKRTTILRTASWEEFEAEIKNFEDPSRKLWDEVWFRGQADAKWPLLTTLERRSNKTRAVASYLNLISEIEPAIETFTGNEFVRPHGPEVEQFCREYDLFGQQLRNHSTYLAHLRHGRFPSPLMDWTLSPYVAAYFAFHNARHDGDVAIYAYREWASRFKVGGSDTPHIVSFGPLFKTHKRHFRQQSRYTACVQFENGQWYFKPHEAVFGQIGQTQQDLLWKISIPASERLKVLRFCDKVNLNEFTLFDSEESLLEMQAMRVFDLRM
jgi:FRG domain-containing protein